jgi:flagellar biosynthesis protein FlhG
MNHYEMLEVSRDAAPEEIERAYRMVRGTYEDNSLAVYSVFATAESGQIRERVELAYRVLSNDDERRRYDATLEDAPRPRAEPPLPFEFDDDDRVGPPPAELTPEIQGLDDLDDEDEFSEFGGSRLRRARLRRGLELEQISKITKINPAYLRFLEEEQVEGLPAAVYVRGFVTAYARCVGLDASSVAASYMERFEQLRSRPRQAPEAPRP